VRLEAGPVLKAVVAEVVPYGPAIAEHCCLAAGLQPQQDLAAAAAVRSSRPCRCLLPVQSFESWLAALDQGAVAEGMISAVAAPTGTRTEAAAGAGQPAAAVPQQTGSSSSRQDR